MSFDFSGFFKILELVAPSVAAAAGVPPFLVPLVAHGIQIAEKATESNPTITGADKKAIALDAVATGIAGINAVKPGTVDPNVTAVVDEGIDAVVGAINAVQKKPIKVN